MYASAPGGVWILSPGGKHLSTVEPPEQPANFAWGDDDGRTLYMTVRAALYGVRLEARGCGREALGERPLGFLGLDGTAIVTGRHGDAKPHSLDISADSPDAFLQNVIRSLG